jgi:hypothetical protein
MVPGSAGGAVSGSAAAFPDVGEEITVSWPEEKIAPRPNSYSSVTTGGLFYKTTVRRGETAEQAFVRAYEVISRMGEQFRQRKLASFLRVLDEAASG